ncbi:MAG: sigma 54-interacting transcriptional regulator [Acidobacteriota bacterium]
MNIKQRRFAEAVAELPYCNPFLPERVEYERQALGEDFVEHGVVWHFATEDENPNVVEIDARLEPIFEELRELILRGEPTAEDRRLYRDVGFYVLYYRYQERLRRMLLSETPEGRRSAPFFDEFAADASRILLDPDLGLEDRVAPEVAFAWFYQARRAFQFIHRSIIGGSMPTAKLRAAVWESVFTRDMRRFRRSLYERMGDFTTLITGPSGTGKELVARAIGLSRYIPFDPIRREFTEDYREAFYALNLSALSPTLIESELFGHQKGAFTGALSDRAGWFEDCPPLGAVFLDEIGEIDESIQVKLLRVLQTRTFQRLGDTTDRLFRGKLIAATNRNPHDEMQAGRMRQDFYYRLCSDLVSTPSLSEQLQDAPEELENLVLSVAAQTVGRDEAESVALEVLDWVARELGPRYAWPGNFRELEQCVRNVIVRGAYSRPTASEPEDDLFAPLRSCNLSAEELLNWYTTLVYQREGSYLAASRALEMDRRTVKSRVDEDLLRRFEGSH